MKSLKLGGLAILAAFICPVFTSCGGDDDDDGGNGGNGGSGVDVFDGKQLTSVGDLTFSYDSKNRCDGLSVCGSQKVSINYSKGTIEFADDDDEVPGTVKIKFNSKGYIAEISGGGSGKEDGVSYSVSGKYTFTYNSNGNLIKVHATTQEKAQGYSYSDEYNETYKWVDGNLVEANCTYTEIEDGEKETGSYESVVTYGEDVNKYGQYTVGLSGVIVEAADDDMGIFSLVGMFGKGTANLPVSVAESWEEGSYQGSYTKNFSFTYNADDAIASETENNNGYAQTYIYTYGAPRSAAVDYGFEQKFDFSKLFRHRARSKRVAE